VKSVCIFCGSTFGRDGLYLTAARSLAAAIASRGITLVYGGSTVGLMGAVAEAALALGGRVVGVIPQSLVDREIAHRGLSELHVTAGMDERKRLMSELSEAFIALPGGYGTLEEFSEVLSWAQMGLHAKPCGLLNVAGFYDSFLRFLDGAVAAGFLRSESRALALVDADPELLVSKLEAAPRARYDRWQGPRGDTMPPGAVRSAPWPSTS